MKFKTKGFISLLLACSFTVAAFSGAILYITPRGRVANWSGWTMLGLDKHQWSAIHINACALVLLIAAWHLFMNWRVFWSYIKRRSSGLNLKTEMAVAALVTGLLVAGTIYEVPPLTTFVAWNETIKNSWEQEAPTSPAPHAEEFTLTRFAGNLGIDVNEMVASLQQQGLDVEDSEITVGTLAAENGIVPSQVYSLVSKSFPEAIPSTPRGPGNGQGRGRGMGRGQFAARGSSGSETGCNHSADAGCGETTASGAGCDKSATNGSDRADLDCQNRPGATANGPGPVPGGGPGMGQGLGPGRGMGRGLGPGGGRGRGWHSDESRHPATGEQGGDQASDGQNDA
jgi:hypothetical protein